MNRSEAELVIEMAADLWMVSQDGLPYEIDWRPYQPLVWDAVNTVPRLRRSRRIVLEEILKGYLEGGAS